MNNRMIDVTEEFSCPCQTEAYMDAYRDWRRRKKNRYAFRFSRNPKEAAFSEDLSVISETPAQAEKSVLRRLGSLIGVALVCCIAIENLLDKLIVLALGHMGFPVGLFFSGEFRIFGEDQIIFWVAAGVLFLKFLIPAVIMQCMLRMPLRVSTPLRVTNFSNMLAGLILMMTASIVLGLLQGSYVAEIKKYRLISDAVDTDDHRIILYLLFTVLFVPVITEFLLHGCLFQVLRQFGDVPAILITSLLAGLLTHNLMDAVRMGIVTLMISYFMITTGSFLTAALMHVIHEIYMFALFYTETFAETHSLQWWLLVLLPCLMGGIAIVYVMRDKREHPGRLFRNETYLSYRDQLTAFFSSMPIIAFCISCVLLAVMTAILE